MANDPIDPGNLEGDALQHWYSRSPEDIERERQARDRERYIEFFGRDPAQPQGAVGTPVNLQPVRSDRLGSDETPEPMNPGLRFAEARQGDSISKLIGSSDPRAIGKFLSLNRMDGSSSTLREGRSYVVPEDWHDASHTEAAAGQGLLHADNARSRALVGKSADDAVAYQQMQRLQQGRNIWTGELAPLERSPAGAPSRAQRSWLDDSKAAKAVAGTVAQAAGVIPGVARGGVHTLEGAVDGGVFLGRLALNLPGDTAWQDVGRVGSAAIDYTKRAVNDPAVVGRDLRTAAGKAWADQVPTATPAADTIGDEVKRRFKLGLNNGELLFDGASLLVGGEALRGAAELGAAAKAADAAETAYLGARPALKAYMDQPYRGPMGHHIVARSKKAPSWLGGGPYPKAVMESPLNKIRETNMTNRDFYRNHFGVDKSYWGGSVRREFGGGGWSGKRLGWTDYGPIDRLRYGTAPPTQAIAGSGLVGGTTDTLWNSENVQ
jgi:hypothetical protein